MRNLVLIYLLLFIRVFQQPERIAKSDITVAFKRATTFLEKASEGLHLRLEESSPAFAMSERIYSLLKANALSKVRIFLFSDGIVKEELNNSEIIGLPVVFRVWDIERVFRLETSGNEREPIRIDFRERGLPLDCLPMPIDNSVYTSYLAIVPANVLVDIYRDYGSRLLEANVRSFLQVRGKVNLGIQTTLRKEPQMFLAYNNGLAATASSVEIETINGRPAITAISDLQIVNGGQTTASLFHAANRNKYDLSLAFVQMKLSVVHKVDRFDDFVRDIAMYANSQNKVSEADFSANDPFQRKIEQLSRTVWAPSVNGGLQTRWFYERARGSFADLRSREGNTEARLKKFDLTYPRKQMFTKTDLAKFEATWDGFPHIVSRGAQKNFNDHADRNKGRAGYDPNEIYFHHLIAKAILFRTAETLVGKQGYGGYRSQIVTYTLAYLAHASDQRIDLDRIWREQSLSQALENTIIDISKSVFDHIVNPVNQQNIAEWCKKEQCWKTCQNLLIPFSSTLRRELVPGKKVDQREKDTLQLREADQGKVEKIRLLPAPEWYRLAKWAKDNDFLSPRQRSISFTIGNTVNSGKIPTEKQASAAIGILSEALSLGFKPDGVDLSDI